MAEGDWDDDSAYKDAVQRAERTTRFGWLTIGATVGTLGCALLAAIGAVAVIVVLAAYAYIEARG
ncbi:MULTISPECIES: hypothetical protein [unclassified Streptomyces]|uniref:hypothetical protein n=1 Tax=unclassified Streptomyces TaxID=2593676 RepID=UPI000DAD6746|nr:MULTISPECIES: hypothetical protein [unclassified Streptomyces]PZT71940.1 hypothetical protein DNK55_25345 [Streptomyces sp. AC1-42T]PZT81733.1 hypothetical protein DNK56_06215 [Streptomyces sp. AC1-42W]WUC93817.1 hypothetical protein OG710_09470 [Streptomyces sp. NBC_00525]